MSSICRLCLNGISLIVAKSLDEISSQNAKIQLLVPEIDINIIPIFNLCNYCTDSLNSAYIFKQTCIQTEDSIKEYINCMKTIIVDLEDVRKYRLKNSDGVICKDEIKVEVNNVDVTSADFEDVTNIKSEVKLICDKCSEGFYCYDQFQKHTELCLVYKCQLCERIFCNKERLEEHQASYSNNKSYSCEVCSKSFHRKYDWMRHRAAVHSLSDISLKCNECNRTFLTENSFKRHTLIANCSKGKKYYATCSIPKPYSCEVCHKSFNRNFDMKRHRRVVHSLPDIPVNCNDCNEVFPNEKSLKEHTLIAHSTKEKKYFCDVCHNGYANLVALIKHKEIHTDKKYDCTVCSKTFSGSVKLHQHMTNTHFGKFTCETCGLKCGRKSLLEEHLRSHTGEKPFKCENCGKGFSQLGSLTVHIRSVHNTEKPYVCDTCGKAFTIRTYLKLHAKTHSSEKDFLCNVCDKTFGTNRNLREHMRIHVGAKNHKCPVCAKEFLVPYDLKKHMRTHTGEKPYECHTCQKRFSQKYNMQIHFRSHRPKNKISKKSHL